MKTTLNIHGIISLLLVYMSFTIGGIIVFQHSTIIGWLYILSLILFHILIPVIYCSKCDGRNHCQHYLMGKISKMLSKPKSSDYTISDTIITFLFIVIPVLIPQFWLFNHWVYFALYWVLFFAAGIEVRYAVCVRCENKKCAMCRNC